MGQPQSYESNNLSMRLSHLTYFDRKLVLTMGSTSLCSSVTFTRKCSSQAYETLLNMRIPYVIDNIEYRLGDVLNYLLRREQGQQVDVATTYFSIRGFAQLRDTLSSVRRVRLLLGDKPLEGEDIGLRPDSAAYLRHELNAEPFTASTLRLVEDLIRFLRRDDVDVRLYLGHGPNESSRGYFLHAKCYLFYGGRGDAKSLIDNMNQNEGKVESRNLT